MSYIRPVDHLGELEPLAQRVYAHFGFVPNTLYTMAHRPEIVRSFLVLAGSVITKTLDPSLRLLVGQMARTAAGCRYCQTHTARQANLVGVDAKKVAALWNFETDAHFTPAERSALRLARDAAVVPNAVTPQHFAEAALYFDEGQLVEIVPIVALFGLLNRWNDTLATQLEPPMLVFAQEHLTTGGWAAGKHAPASRLDGSHL